MCFSETGGTGQKRIELSFFSSCNFLCFYCTLLKFPTESSFWKKLILVISVFSVKSHTPAPFILIFLYFMFYTNKPNVCDVLFLTLY